MEDGDAKVVGEVGEPVIAPMAVLLVEECYSLERQDYYSEVRLLQWASIGDVIKVEPVRGVVRDAVLYLHWYSSLG